jgi:hypothetical protein
MVEQTAPDNTIKNQIVVNGKRFQVDGTVDLKFTPIEDPTPIPDPDPDPTKEKPKEGTIKEGGWGGNVDPKTWKVTEMRNPSDQFKVVDDKGVNIATNFTTMQFAQNFINYFLVNPFPPEEEEQGEGGTGGGEQEPGGGAGGNGGSGGGDVVVGKGKDKFGSQLLVSDGKEVEYAIKDNLRDDGQRFDGDVGDWPQSEATGYFMFTKDPVDDEVSIKWSEMKHSGSNDVQCYDSGVSIKDGKARLRFENPHPDYSGNLGSGQGTPMKAGKWYGYKGAKIVNSDGTVTIKLWQSVGDNETKPANDWKEIFSYTDKKYKRTGAHPHVTFRVDDPDKKGQPNLRKQWLSVAKIG